MQPDVSFSAAYRVLEKRMQAQAEADGDVFPPNPAPERPVDYVLICMEPSLGHWARTRDEARSKVKAGFRNFLSSLEVQILHFCARRYLCSTDQRYYITDLSKGAMLVEHAGDARFERYSRWYAILEKELALVSRPGAGVVAVGDVVSEHLKRRGFGQPFTPVIHYSGQAARARKAGIVGHDRAYEAFRNSVSLSEILCNAERVVHGAGLPAEAGAKILSRLAKSPLSESRRQLIFNYKTVFESMRCSRPL
jgi:hypothetical protein